MRRRAFLKNTGAIGLLTLITPSGLVQALGQNSIKGLEQGFMNPPLGARPYTWWHWMNGNVTADGITRDIEAMKEIGLGGFQNFDAGTGIPKGPVVYLSPQWLKLKEHAIKEAGRLGLEFGMHNCPGWSSSGGPWITPELAMQGLTWSELRLSGGKTVTAKLPQPSSKLSFYRDIAVLAFPAQAGELPLHDLVMRITSSDGALNRRDFGDASKDGLVIKPATGEKTAWLQFEFKEPYEARAISFLSSATDKNAAGQQGFGGGPGLTLEYSADGQQFQKAASLNAAEQFSTADFPPVIAKYFRIVSPDARQFEQVHFSGAERLKDWQKKANYRFSGMEGAQEHTAEVSETALIPINAIVELTTMVDKDGMLRWNAPKGDWTVMRFGFTPLGTMNRSAPDTGVGLECDKYSKEAITFHFNKMMEHLLPTLAPLAKKGKVGLLIDSYEVGMQNWTPLFAREFEKRRGYSLIKYLPAMTGRIVDNADTTERFLWDIRRVQADLIADNYYGALTGLCHQHGMLSYTQPYDRGPMEEMQIGSRVDINEGEFWNGLSTLFQNNWTMRRTIKLSAAIAHVNGQKVVGGESFTSEPESARWQEYPFGMKALGDRMFTQGLNRIVFHRYAHQPHPSAVPGMTMGPWGIHFDRTTTWWKQGRAWINYLSRCQYLLQQGHFVADLAYYSGEEGNAYTAVHRNQLNPAPPEGYDYDLINAEVIVKKAAVKDGRLVLPDGMSYRLLVLQNPKAISMNVLRKLADLVKGGMMLVGARPERSLELNIDDKEAIEFQQLVAALWGDKGGDAVSSNYGLGRVIWGSPLSELLQRVKVAPDFSVSSKSGDAPINYMHRRDGATDIYFVANQRRRYEELVCTFRVGAKQPELWDADSGAIAPAGVFEVVDGTVRMPLHLAPYGSVFIVFRSPAGGAPVHAVAKDGVTVYSTAAFPEVKRSMYSGVANNFSIVIWAKPESNIMLSTQNFMEGIAAPWTDYFAIYPPAGAVLYGAGRAACGITIGRNGVAVWENEKGTPKMVLAATHNISGWSHVALVYLQGKPSVYVNGKKIKEGTKSEYVVHPGLGQAYLSEGASYYNGDLTEPQLFGEVLSEEKLAQITGIKPSILKTPIVSIEPAPGIKPAVLIWENGNYEFQSGNNKNAAFKVSNIRAPVDISEQWSVAFPKGMGAPDRITLPQLISLHEHVVPGVKYFSGTATYTKSFSLTTNAIGGNNQLFLDLGQVAVLAEVILNGKALGVLWKRPYRVNITKVATAGANTLEIKVTNLWPNRLIGDEQVADDNKYTAGGGAGGFASLSNGAIEQLPEWYQAGKPKPDNGRVTFTTWKHYNKESPLLESGLIGPVVILSAYAKTL